MSNTYYCVCLDCLVVEEVKDGEEEEFKNKHYGHGILIYYPAYSEISHYDPEEKVTERFTLVE